MKIVLTESQYKQILVEDFRQSVDDVLQSSYNFTKDIVNQASRQLKQSFQFLLTYGAGIGSLARPLTEYLEGKYTYLTKEEIAGLAVMAISMLYYQHKGELQKPLQLIKLKGQISELEDAISKVKSVDNRFRNVLRQLGIYVYNILDIPAYTFLLPVVPLIISFLTDPANSGDKIEMALNGLLNSSLLTLSAATIRKILDRLSRIKNLR
jgi:hypothetical protein